MAEFFPEQTEHNTLPSVGEMINRHIKDTGEEINEVVCHPNMLGMILAQACRDGVELGTVIVDTKIPEGMFWPNPKPTEEFMTTLRSFTVLVAPDMLAEVE